MPTLNSAQARIREVERRDAHALLQEFSGPDVCRFIPQPPDSVAAFEEFIGRENQARRDGRAACFAVLAVGEATPLGLIKLSILSDGRWHWGFVLSARAWGTGLFAAAARLVLQFAFEDLGLAEVEAWSLLANGRAHGALAKLGARPELLCHTQAPDGRRGDFVRWTLTSEGQSADSGAGGTPFP